MARNKNDLILESCKESGTPDPTGGTGGDGTAQSEYLFSIGPRQQDYSTEELYVVQEQIKSDLLDPLKDITGYYWYYAGDQFDIERQRLLLAKPNVTLIKVDQYYRDDATFAIDQMIELDRSFLDSKEQLNIQFTEELFEEKLVQIEQELSNSANDFKYIVVGSNNPVQRIVDSSFREPFSIETKNNYNYFDEAYEDKADTYDTTVLPNYYLLSEDNYYRSIGGGQEYKNTLLATYDENINTSIHQYIESFSEEQLSTETTNRISIKMKNILFPHNKMVSYEEMREAKTKEIFPFSLQLEFDTEPVGRISRAIKEDQINDYLLSYIRRKEDQEEMENIPFTIKGNNLPLRKRASIDTLLLSDQFFENLMDQDDLEDSDVCYLDNIETNNIEPINFHEEQNLLKSEQVMSYDMMLEGKSCYSETLYYKVDKYEIEQENYQKVQSFYLSNVDDVSKVKILDTQVKYGKKYRYEVFSYKYVLGYKYSYQQNENLNSFYTVTIVPTPYLIKMSFGQIEEVVLDKPPSPPEVEVIPYKDNSEEISFFFNPSSIQYKMQEYAFSEEEQLQYALVRDSQNLDNNEMITFGGDDTTEKYYIYRIDKRPFSYEDFVNNLYKIVETEENCSSAEYLDTIMSNKKYYYIFRSVDAHEHISPPTEVMEIELINEGGTTFLHSQIVPFKNVSFQKEEKSVRRYIHIKPTLIQSLIKEDTLQAIDENGNDIETTALEVLNSVSLGDDRFIEESVWGKKFKMRIKSKSTNKFVDVKFSFKTKKEQNNL